MALRPPTSQNQSRAFQEQLALPLELPKSARVGPSQSHELSKGRRLRLSPDRLERDRAILARRGIVPVSSTQNNNATFFRQRQAADKLIGEVEVDGAYFGGYLKPANWKENRVDRRLAKNQNGKRRVVVVARERDGRTVTNVFRSEGEAVQMIEARVHADATIHADEAVSWDRLHATYLTRRINHQECYSDGAACTNMAESFFSRLRRAEVGIHHHISGKYLASYAGEMAWREDRRRMSNGEQYLMMTAAAAAHPVSRQWKGYWQRAA